MEDLYERVLAPLVLGETVRPVRPLGPRRTEAIAGLAEVFTPPDVAQRARVEEGRLRVARRLWPLDVLPAIDEGTWRLVCAFSDLLQVVNPHLAGPLATSRPRKLLSFALATIEAVPAPTTALAALARHATLAGATRLVRVDTRVVWWVGAAEFRGQKPPERLLAWPSLRRVHTAEQEASLAELANHVAAPKDAWAPAIARWLTRSPLSDLASAGREAPPFTWTPETLSLVASPVAAAMARRATADGGARAEVALDRATRALSGPGREIAEDFVRGRRAAAAASP